MCRAARSMIAAGVLISIVLVGHVGADAVTPGQRLDTLLDQRSASSSSVSVTDLTAGRTLTVGRSSGMVTASVVKLELLETELAVDQTHKREPTAAERGHLAPMIEHSSNADADWVFHHLGDRSGVERWEHHLGLSPRLTVVGRAGRWGLTTTGAAQQVVLLHNLVDPRSPLDSHNRTYALSLMRHVEHDQRWGVPTVATSGTSANKNGWVSVVHDHGYWAVNSVGVVTVRRHQLLVAVLTQHDHGFVAGVRRVEQLARAAVSATQAQ